MGESQKWVPVILKFAIRAVSTYGTSASSQHEYFIILLFIFLKEG